MSDHLPAPLRYCIVGTFSFDEARAIAERLRGDAESRGKHSSFRFLLTDRAVAETMSRLMACSASAISPDNVSGEDLKNALGDEPLNGVITSFEDFQPGLLCDLEASTFQTALDRNARASWLTAQASVPLLAPVKGRLIALTSRAAREVLAGGGAFGPAKTLEANLLRSMAAEASALGVAINLISPSPAPSGREPADEMAGAIAFLLSDDASGLSSATLAIDGRSVNTGTTRSLFGITARPAERTVSPPAPSSRLRAVVTGGAGSIGTETIRALARLSREQGQEGLDVIVADIDAQRLTDVVASFQQEEIHAVAVTADLGAPGAAEGLIEQAVAHFGGLDFVHSNAGYGITDAALEASAAQWEKIVEINLAATWRMAKAAFPHLQLSGGSLVATSSIASFLANARAPMYSATKAALNMLIAQLAQEWGAFGVRANLISPGSIDTPMNQLASLSAEERDKIARNFPTPRLGRAEEVAEAVAFLASRKASYISGQNLVVDGGLLQSIR